MGTSDPVILQPGDLVAIVTANSVGSYTASASVC
jgi:hypothetical protein